MMERATQAALARRFHELHDSTELLVLPNAWDAGSALIFQKAGFRAIGTTSAGIAYSLGYPDGQQMPFEELLAAQVRIARKVSIPLSVDIESGYGALEEVLDTVKRVIDGGAVGINIEDGVLEGDPRLADCRYQCEVLNAVRNLEHTTGIPFVINARTDSFWLGLADADGQLEESILRGNAYLDAGADCVFVPGRMTRDTISTLVQELVGPLNLIATDGIPSPQELQDLGVARLSVGSAPARASLGVVRQIADDLKRGSLTWLSDVALGYDEANQLFE